jgi:spermidine/putrescine transport system substrate-binding protein
MRNDAHDGLFDRREFLKRTAAGALAVPGLAALLAACGDSGTPSSEGPATFIGLASPDKPRTLPIYDDNQPIPDGGAPEPGPLKVYNWVDYTYKKVIKQFEEEFGVDVEVSNFASSSEALQKVRTGSIDFDVFFPTTDIVGKLVAAKFLQPLNLSYIPNLQANVWPELADPYYDQGSRYTVPYMTWKTGIGYRRDELAEDPYSMTNPYDLFWDPRYRGKVGVYNEYRDTIGMTLLRNGHEDVNTSDPALIEEAKQSLIEMAETVDVRVATQNDDYVVIPEGNAWVHNSWSGNMVYAQYYLPKGTDVDVLGFWFPEDGRGMIASDTIAISSTAKNPVLAHEYINFLLDNDNALLNMSYEGYQPPLTSIEPSKVVSAGYVPENLSTTVVRQEDFQNGLYQLELAPDVEAMWQDAWAEFKTGA